VNVQDSHVHYKFKECYGYTVIPLLKRAIKIMCLVFCRNKLDLVLIGITIK
jgi:hypothetical protein